MKKILLLSISCVILLGQISAQTTDCNANFTWNFSGTTVKFTPQITSDAATWYHAWSFGDASVPVSVISPYHTFPAIGGTFIVSHVIIKYSTTGAIICKDSVTKEITIQPDCVAPDFTFQQDADNFLKIKFTNTSHFYTTTDSIAWMFGDGTTSNDINATHTYANAGTYHVCLLIKKRNTTTLCTKEKCYEVTVTRPCDLKVNFDWQKDPTVFGKVYFVNNTPGFNTTDSIKWSFGDGSTYSTNNNPDHRYANAGVYTVCLWIKRNDNVPGTAACSQTICKTIEIVSTDCSIAPSFTTEANLTLPTKIKFTNATTGLLSVDSIRWSFGDGTYTNEMSPTHTYATSGTYTVLLEISHKNSAGQIVCVKSYNKEITVAVFCNFTPTFTFKKDSVVSTIYKYNFENTTTLISNFDSVKWVFGDGTESYHNELSPVHVYTKAGTYNVCLTIIKRNNLYQSTDCKKDICKTVVITESIPCDFVASYSIKADSLNKKLINFTNTTHFTTTDPAATAIWYFGDGSTATAGWNAVHEYLHPGKYKVCLRVEYTTTCVKYTCDSITVLDNTVPCDFIPNYTFTANTDNKKKINFATTSTSTLTTGTVTWSFGDGTANGTGWNITHEYTSAGKYYVCAKIQYGTACYKYKCDSVTVSDNPPPCDFTPNYTWTANTDNKKKINFAATSTSTLTTGTVTWSFGDGTANGTGWNITHEYTSAGKYYVCAKIQYSTACYKYKCDSVTVSDNPPPCDFTPNYTFTANTDNKKKINFAATSTSTLTTGTVTWSFGDGTSSTTGWNVTHEYATAGKYYVCAKIQYSTTCYKYKCDSVTVTISETINCNQLSLFTYSSITATNLFSFMPVNPNTDVQYTWTFGDGTGSHDRTSSHQYTINSTYNVCLTAYKNNSCASTTCKEIKIASTLFCDSVKAAYQYYKDQYIVNKLHFYAYSSAGIQQQSWTIRKVGSSAVPITITQNNPVYSFNDTGYYNICLRIVTTAGCVKEYCSVIHIESITHLCELQAYPNPANSQVSLNVEMDATETIHAYVYSVENILVAQKNQPGLAGNNLVIINTANLPAGIYTVKVIYGGKMCFAKFQKI